MAFLSVDVPELVVVVVVVVVVMLVLVVGGGAFAAGGGGGAVGEVGDEVGDIRGEEAILCG